jgi:hypothetical protein
MYRCYVIVTGLEERERGKGNKKLKTKTGRKRKRRKESLRGERKYDIEGENEEKR